MKKAILFLLFFSITFSYSQNISQWEGHYAGELEVKTLSNQPVSFHMELIFFQLTDSTYTWTIIYGEDSLRQERKYTLKHLEENQYEIDEGNSIVLSSNLINNSFISVFEVQGNLIHCIYTFEKRKLIFDLTSSSNKSETGNIESGTDLNNEEIPLVYTYGTVAKQHAVLKMIKRK